MAEESYRAEIDLLDLLTRYMRHVRDCEGVTFVDRLNEEMSSTVRFTPAEVAFLESLDRSPRPRSNA